MKFADLASGQAVFVDANVFVYAFGPDPEFGPRASNYWNESSNTTFEGSLRRMCCVMLPIG